MGELEFIFVIVLRPQWLLSFTFTIKRKDYLFEMNTLLEKQFSGKTAPADLIQARLKDFPGQTACYFENLCTGETVSWHAEDPLLSASVIKLFVLAAAFEQMKQGILSREERVVLHEADKVPPSGALYFLHEGVELTVMDLCRLMIVFSDNVATNLLCDRIGIPYIQDFMKRNGFEKSVLNRKMFDYESAKKGLQNYVTAAEVGRFFSMLYHEELVSAAASREMLSILKEQQVNGKIPFYLERLDDAPEIAHKTGEDEGITNDAGIVYGKTPFILSLLGNSIDTAAYEKVMQDLALELYTSLSL